VVATPQPDDISAQVSNLQRQIDEMNRKTLYSASIEEGGLTIKGGFLRLLDDSGQERVFIGQSPFAQDTGDTQPVFWVRDDTGKIRLGVFDAEPGPTYKPTFWTFDDNQRVAFTTDQSGGVAEPWVPVPMYMKFIPNSFVNATNTDPTLPVSACNGGVIWNGRIGKVSHPRIQFDMITGRVTGGSGSPTYTFWVNGSQVGTFSGTGYGSNLVGPFDISSILTATNVIVEVKVSATGTGTDLIACGMNGVWLRQT
jgi:hypothetical protein